MYRDRILDKLIKLMEIENDDNEIEWIEKAIDTFTLSCKP